LLGFDVTLQLDLSSVPENWEELVKKCGLLKRNCFAAVFEKYFDFQVLHIYAQRDRRKRTGPDQRPAHRDRKKRRKF
jgi:hypothetical protein